MRPPWRAVTPSGDVLGALTEIATAVCLVLLSAGGHSH